MKTYIKKVLAAVAAVGFVSCGSAVYENPADQYGWYDAPYIRYEAEADAASGQCIFLQKSEYKKHVQSEASNMRAAQLVAKGDFVEWECRKAANGMVIRFSLPDAPQGGGTKGNVDLYVNDRLVREIELDSYHAWQYKKAGYGDYNWYYDNTPAEDKYAKMMFDEKRILLDENIRRGAKFRLVKSDDNSVAYTIDFVELEAVPAPVTYREVMSAKSICYNPDEGVSLADFVNENQGRTIYLPSGLFKTDRNIVLEADTKIIGAGSWYTEICFTADPNDTSTVVQRGFYPAGRPDNCELRNLYLGSLLDRRYLNYCNPETGLSGLECGMGLCGDFGDNFIMEDVWIEHFECGMWIRTDKDSRIKYCRFRNNYADGVNLAQGINQELSHCNMRNNGDDQLLLKYVEGQDEASTVVHHCTMDLGWRAGGIGVIGGWNLNVHDILINDHLETGMRLLTEFYGHEYKENIRFSRIRFNNCGGRGGKDALAYGSMSGESSVVLGFSLWGFYDIKGVTFSNLDIISPRGGGISFGGNRSVSCTFENINLTDWNEYGIAFYKDCTGEVKYRNLNLHGNKETEMSDIPETMKFLEIK